MDAGLGRGLREGASPRPEHHSPCPVFPVETRSGQLQLRTVDSHQWLREQTVPSACCRPSAPSHGHSLPTRWVRVGASVLAYTGGTLGKSHFKLQIHSAGVRWVVLIHPQVFTGQWARGCEGRVGRGSRETEVELGVVSQAFPGWKKVGFMEDLEMEEPGALASSTSQTPGLHGQLATPLPMWLLLSTHGT